MNFLKEKQQADDINIYCKSVYDKLVNIKHDTKQDNVDLDTRHLEKVFDSCSYCIKMLQTIPCICAKQKVISYIIIRNLRNLYLDFHYMYEKGDY